MKLSRAFGLVAQSIRRNRRDFVFSSVGIVIGIATLFFFTALGQGIKTAVLERVFVIGQLEVVKPSYDVGAFSTEGLFGGGKRLDDDTVEALRQIPGVDGVYPKMRLTFPSSARGGESIFGRKMSTELVADGIPPELVDAGGGEAGDEFAFRDWEAMTCTSDADCPTSHGCTAGACQGTACATDDDCASPAYCAASLAEGGEGGEADDDGASRCAMPIPVVLSPRLLEIYNGSVQTALGGAQGAMSKLPKLSEKALIGFGFEGLFGRSYLGSSARGGHVTRRMRIVGFSDKAMNLGATMPLGYVERLNARFGKAGDASEYHAILVDTASNDVVPAVARAITEGLGFALSDAYQNAQRAGLLILLITLVFNLISLVILAIAAVNIMHTFLMIILERRRELALMRAVGATRADIRRLVLGEATVLGLIGGLLGVGLGLLATLATDALFDAQVADFPFKPDSLFLVEGWIFALGIGVAVLFCWLGALLPALRAGRIDPASALAGR